MLDCQGKQVRACKDERIKTHVWGVGRGLDVRYHDELAKDFSAPGQLVVDNGLRKARPLLEVIQQPEFLVQFESTRLQHVQRCLRQQTRAAYLDTRTLLPAARDGELVDDTDTKAVLRQAESGDEARGTCANLSVVKVRKHVFATNEDCAQ